MHSFIASFKLEMGSDWMIDCVIQFGESVSEWRYVAQRREWMYKWVRECVGKWVGECECDWEWVSDFSP